MKVRGVSISIQIFIFLFIVAFIPVAITMALKTYEKQLLNMLENSNVQQGRLVAAALESSGGKDFWNIDKDFAQALLENMQGQFDSRIRILDSQGRLLTDSSRLKRNFLQEKDEVQETRDDSSTGENLSAAEGQSKETSSSETFIYRLFSFPFRFYRNHIKPPRYYDTADFYDNKLIYNGTEVLTALEGNYGAKTRISSGGQISVTLYSAIPVKNDSQVIGAVLVSRSTYRILQNLYELRLDLGKIFLRSLIAVLIIAIFLVFRIVRPIRKLSLQAGQCADKKGRVSFTNFTGSKRLDEIGQLSRAFTALVERLNRRIQFSQAFSSDISHEFKNPLTAIRSSAELLGDTKINESQRIELSQAIVDEVSHLQSLLTGVRNISKIDAQSAIDSKSDREKASEFEAIPLNSLIKNLAGRLQKNYPNASFEFTSSREEIDLKIPLEYLEIIASNLIDNAFSFSTKVKISTEFTEGKKESLFRLSVEDNGPGLKEEQIQKIFNRFYSERNEEGKASHTGLGLSLVKAVSDTLEGQILVSQSSLLGGAKFTFEMKLSSSSFINR